MKKKRPSKVLPAIFLFSLAVLCVCIGVVLLAPGLARKIEISYHLYNYKIKKQVHSLLLPLNSKSNQTKEVNPDLKCLPEISPTPTVKQKEYRLESRFDDIPGYYDSLINSGKTATEAARLYCIKRYGGFDPACVLHKMQTELFTYYNDDYALTADTVYITRRSGGSYVYIERDFVDFDTFEYLGFEYFKDKNGVYYDDNEGAGEYPTKKIQNVDPDSVVIFSHQFVKDTNAVYFDLPLNYGDEKINMKVLEAADPATFCKADTDTYFDRNNIYLTSHNILKVIPRNE